MKTIRYCGATVLVMLLVTGVALADAGDEHRGHHSSAMPSGHWMAPEDAASQKNPVSVNAESIARGRKVFEANCVVCHGPNGNGDGPAGAALNPRPTNLRAMAGRHDDGDFAWKIANGRGPMPAWKGMLSETQIWEVVNYIQSLGPAAKKGDTGHGSHGGHKY